MKRGIYIGIACLVMTGMLGCGLGEGGEEGNISKAPENVTPTMAISDIFHPAENVVIGQGTEGLESDVYFVLKEFLKKTEAAADLEKYNGANRMDFAGDPKELSLFCIDSETGVVYFVNQKKDYYIYRLKDGIVELAVELPAKELYIQGGKLYFMLESYEKYKLEGKREGDIYVYIPEEGKVELVYEAGKAWEDASLGILEDRQQRMKVKEEGIYFINGISVEMKEVNGKQVMITKENACLLPFDSEEIKEDLGSNTKVGWKEYYIRYRVDESNVGYLEMRSENAEGEKKRYEKMSPFCVIGDELCGIRGYQICCINLMSEEEKIYDLEPFLYQLRLESFGGTKEEFDELVLASGARYTTLEYFSVVQDNIWVSDIDNRLFCINRESGEITDFALEKTVTIELLYTDGRDLYVLTGNGIAKVLIEEKLISLEFLTGRE